MKSKTRSTLDSYYNEWENHEDDESFVSSGGGLNEWTNFEESISYKNGFETYNPCLHTKVNQTYGTGEHVWDISSDGRHTHTYATGTKLTPSGIIALVKDYLYYDSYDWLAFCQRAVAAMTPSMESSFSLVNFLHELRETRTLLPFRRRPKRLGIRNLEKERYQNPRIANGQIVDPKLAKAGGIRWWWDQEASIFRNLSGLMLNYSFGVVPFIGDMKRIHKGLTTFYDRLSDLHRNAGKLQVRRYSEEGAALDWDVDSDNGTNMRIRTNWKVGSLTRTAVMQYTYQLPDLTREQWILRSLLDTLGVQLNPGIVWEAIPYSFVGDWFLSIGKYLDRMRRKWIEVNLYIKNFGTSIKFEGEFTSEIQRYSPYDESEWDKRGSGSFKYYARRPRAVDDRFFGIDLSTIETPDSLSLRKYILGGLLIEQRIPRF